MDDRTDLTGEGVAATRTAFGRREMLQRTGFVVGAAALWNTPIIRTVGMSAAAATNGEGTPLCLDQDGFPVNCIGEKPKAVSFELVSWDEASEPVWRPFSGVLNLCNQTFTGNNRYRRSSIPLADITDFRYGIGQLNSVSNLSVLEPISKLDSCFEVPADAAFVSLLFYDEGGNSVLEIAIHTSCSEQLECGDEFANVRVCGGRDFLNNPVSC